MKLLYATIYIMAKRRKSHERSHSTRRHSLGRGKKTKTTAAATRRKKEARRRRARATVHRESAARHARERETIRRLEQMRRERHTHGSRAHQKWDEARYEMEDFLGY